MLLGPISINGAIYFKTMRTQFPRRITVNEIRKKILKFVILYSKMYFFDFISYGTIDIKRFLRPILDIRNIQLNFHSIICFVVVLYDVEWLGPVLCRRHCLYKYVHTSIQSITILCVCVCWTVVYGRLMELYKMRNNSTAGDH